MQRFAILILILVSSTFLNYSFSKPLNNVYSRPLEFFPKQIGPWKFLNEQKIGESSMAVLRVDDYIMRNYSNANGDTINLYIGFFETQKEGKQVHSPRQCLPGAGWDIIEHREYSLPQTLTKISKSSINAHLMGNGPNKSLFLWWYHGRGRIYSNEYMNKFYLIWDSIFKRRNDGALVRINMNVESSYQETLETELSFVNLLIPLLGEYIPD